MKIIIDRIIDRLANRIGAYLAPVLAAKLHGVAESAGLPWGDAPEVKSVVHDLYIHQGQTLTVFAGAKRLLGDAPPYEQIELRVTPAGAVEIFSNVKTRTSEHWKPMEADVRRGRARANARRPVKLTKASP